MPPCGENVGSALVARGLGHLTTDQEGRVESLQGAFNRSRGGFLLISTGLFAHGTVVVVACVRRFLRMSLALDCSDDGFNGAP